MYLTDIEYAQKYLQLYSCSFIDVDTSKIKPYVHTFRIVHKQQSRIRNSSSVKKSSDHKLTSSHFKVEIMLNVIFVSVFVVFYNLEFFLVVNSAGQREARDADGGYVSRAGGLVPHDVKALPVVVVLLRGLPLRDTGPAVAAVGPASRLAERRAAQCDRRWHRCHAHTGAHRRRCNHF